VFEDVPPELLILVCIGLGLLLVILRFDAERFGAAEYDEVVDGVRPPARRRIAWYLVGLLFIGLVIFIHPSPADDLGLGLGDRDQAILLGLLYGTVGTLQALGYAYIRYQRVRFPEIDSYPTALVNSVLTAFIDEATFRGIVLGFLLLSGMEPWLAVVVQALLYAIATRTGAPGRVPYMLALSLLYGLVGGWLTVLTGGIGAAFLGHAITRFAVFLTTGHAGHVAAKGTEVEEVLRRRLTPDGWRVIAAESREQATRDR
jgi:hypothetical protein